VTYTDDHEALVLACLAQRVRARQDAVKAIVGQRYADGHRETIRSPLGEKLGIILRTDPDPSWQVTDWAALRAHFATYDGTSETVHEIADEAAAIEVLRRHAPHLLVEVTKLRTDVVDAALEQSAATGEPAVPGISLVKPAGNLTVRPDKAAGVAVERMIAAGLIGWDGRPAIETAREAS
jgi:hypothetical protein